MENLEQIQLVIVIVFGLITLVAILIVLGIALINHRNSGGTREGFERLLSEATQAIQNSVPVQALGDILEKQQKPEWVQRGLEAGDAIVGFIPGTADDRFWQALKELITGPPATDEQVEVAEAMYQTALGQVANPETVQRMKQSLAPAPPSKTELPQG